MNRNMYEWLEEVKAAKVKKAMPALSFPAVDDGYQSKRTDFR